MSHPVVEAWRALGDDAVSTIERMRSDARHLRELAGRAKVGVGIAAQDAKVALERAADGVLDQLERAFGRR